MKIITCIKQVPSTTNVELDEKTGNLKRDAHNVKLNPYDLYALEFAFKIKEKISDTNIHVITMGPPAAKESLYEALSMGADDATLISDRKMAGADVLATAFALKELILKLNNADIIICGKQSTDGDTGQVGAELAQLLNIPHVSYVKDVINITPTEITFLLNYENYDEVIIVPFPVLITVEKDFFVPRLPSYKKKLEVSKYEIKTEGIVNFNNQNPQNYGLSGSPTQVKEIVITPKKTAAKLNSGTPEKMAKIIYDAIKSQDL